MATLLWLTLYHPTFCVLPPLLQVFLAAENVVAVELSPEVAVLTAELSLEVVFAVAELSPEVAVLTAELSLEVVFAVAELSPEVAVLTAELSLEVVFAVDLGVSESEVVFVAVVSLADVAEPPASVDIAVASVVLAPVSAVVAEVDSSGHPTFVAFPNVDCYATSASSVEVVGDRSVHSATGVRTNYGLCSILSNLGLHHNKNLEHSYNNPSHGYNTVSDTNHPAMDATTSHSRKTSLHLSQAQRKHRAHQVALSRPEVLQIRRVAVDQY
jgi:uncharacterized small protein (DUF1192 family)